MTNKLPNELEKVLQPSTFETIDQALFDYIDKVLNLQIYTNKGWVKVPVLWVGSERAYQVKHDKELRDSKGIIKYPVIQVVRSGFTKDLNKKGYIWANMPEINDVQGGRYTITKRINQEKTSNFVNADSLRQTGQINFRTRKESKKIVYQHITIPQPVYIEVTYNIHLKSEYQQHANNLITPFVTKPGAHKYIKIYNQHHRYETFIDGEIENNDNKMNMGEDTRLFHDVVRIRVLGYLIGEGPNQEKPKMSIRENAVDIAFPREHVVFGDIPEHLNDNSEYREL